MRRVMVVTVAMAVLGGCKPALSPEVVKTYQARTLFTCCNIHHETASISDANYYVGTLVPLGSAVQVQSSARNALTFTAGGTPLTLSQDYGREQESFQQYLDKVLVPEDPRPLVATFPPDVQAAIRESRVERGMTRQQVILSLGYPPTHRTASTNATEWTYWYNRWVTYKVVFDDAGKVSTVVGRPAPTQDQPIVAAPRPAPTPASHRKKGH